MAHNLPSGRRRDSRRNCRVSSGLMQTIGRFHYLASRVNPSSLASRVNPSSCRTILVVGTLVGGRWTIAFSDLKSGNRRSCLRGRLWSQASDCESRRTAVYGTGRRIAVRNQSAVNARRTRNARSDDRRGQIVFRRATGEERSPWKCASQHHNKRGPAYCECDWSVATDRFTD
jgi:hypothetical protein